jgi:hypothetical protein
MFIWVDNIKRDIRKTSFIYRLNFSLQQGQSGIFGNVYEFIWNKKIFKKFTFEAL